MIIRILAPTVIRYEPTLGESLLGTPKKRIYKTIMVRPFSAVFLVFLSISVGYAQNPATTTPPLPSAASKTAGAAPDYSKQPAVIEQFINGYRWEADGTGSRESTLKVKVQTPLGIQQFGQIPIGYSSANETVKIDYVRVRKPDGRVINVPPENVQDLTAPVAREAPMYSDFRVKQIVVPSLEAGDTIEYDTTIAITKPLAEHEFWFQHDFNKTNLVLDEQLVVNVPAAVKVMLKTNPGAEPKIETAQGRRVYTWKRKNLSVDDGSDGDLKASKRKRNALIDPDRHPDVQMTTFQSWQQVGAWFGALVKDRIPANDLIKAKAEQLVQGKTTEEEKVEAIYDYVSKQYRYVSLSFGIGRYQPHYAADVFSNQYGDCKDKHTLFASMLEAVGIHADPVLINSSRKLDEAVPSPGQFDHVISSVDIDNKPMLLDVTPEVAPFGLLSPNLRHKKALLVSAGGKTKVIDTPASLPFKPKEVISVVGKVNDLGKLEGTMSIQVRGDAELYLRSAFRQVPQAKWPQVAKLFQAAIGINGEATEVKISPVEDTSRPFTLEWKLSAVNYLDWTNKNIDLKLPIPATKLPNFDEETDVADQKPLQVRGAPVNSFYHTRIELPARYAVTLPISINLTRDYGDYRTKYTRDKNTVIAEKQFAFSQYQVPYDRRSDYLAFQRGILADEKQVVHLESASVENAAVPGNMKVDDISEAGVNALQHNNPREAAKLFEKVVALEPMRHDAWNNLGQAYLGQHELKPAEGAFRKQIAINPYDEYAYNGLALTLQAENSFDGAIEAFKKQIEVNPLDQFAHANLGSLLLQRKRFSEAAPELETAVGINPKSAFLQAQLGTAYLNLGENEKAAAGFEKAIQMSPSPVIWNQIAYELSERGVQLDRALSYAESAVSATTANLRNIDLDHLQLADVGNTASISAFWDTLGWIYFKQGDSANALKYISAAWSLAQHSDIAGHLAQIHEKLSHGEEAKRYYGLALAAYLPSPEAHDRALKAFGSESGVSSALSKAKIELVEQRTFSISNADKANGRADFFVLFAPDGKPAGAKYVSGDAGLKPFESQLKQSAIVATIPQGSQAKVVRRGTLSCGPMKDCTFVLQPLEQTTSLD
ncbi:MAG: DUF3857 domain-containing protein [Acidobacteriaceae bacterium]